MKKSFILMAALLLAGVAQAGYVWNVIWSLGGGWAYSPTSDLDLLNSQENYSVTWSLLDADTGKALAGASINASPSSLPQWSDSASGNSVAYTAGLEIRSGTPIFYGTDADANEHNLRQYIKATNGTDTYEWLGDIFTYSGVDDSSSPFPAANKLYNGEIIIGSANSSDSEVNAYWTKVTSVPEPATMSLLGLGALAMVLRRKVRK